MLFSSDLLLFRTLRLQNQRYDNRTGIAQQK